MIKRHKVHKKGSWIVDHLGEFIVMAIVVGVLMYIAWSYLLHGAGSQLTALQKCGALTGNSGVCKETCDSKVELELPNVGCKGLENKCCVLKDENIDDLGLPDGYGIPNDLYNFNIESFYIDTSQTIEGCTIGLTAWRIDCKIGTEIQLPVGMDIINYGTKPVSVYAEPWIVIAGNGRNSVSAVTSPSAKDNPIDIDGGSIDSGSVGKITTNIVISSSYSNLENKYLQIYPYATCSTEECQKGGQDPKLQGLKVTGSGSGKVITITFS